MADQCSRHETCSGRVPAGRPSAGHAIVRRSTQCAFAFVRSGAAPGFDVVTVSTCVASTYENVVTAPSGTVNGMFAPPAAPPAP
ncbi:hypothetical protein GCM10025868_33250 [Angustibacter aerolatus]|uniref:Uncharacterized protein n=1 Tax=Angustibacter aerolatus TaxID=1162965 RepID=A0ABQ6JMT0_9ACTN|nr:hypothetical protein GCM10025868_33250 [Angustibacter aerolatus]